MIVNRALDVVGWKSKTRSAAHVSFRFFTLFSSLFAYERQGKKRLTKCCTLLENFFMTRTSWKLTSRSNTSIWYQHSKPIFLFRNHSSYWPSNALFPQIVGYDVFDLHPG